MRVGSAQDAERRGQVAVQDGVPLLVAHLLHHVVPGEAGVVDDDVDALEIAHRRVDEAVGKVRCGHVAHAGHGFDAHCLQFLDGLLRRLGVQVIDDQARAFACQPHGDGVADAAARTGDQCHLAFKCSHC
ncbi:hypothetical protein D3C72_1996420 [compost metagenome]